MQHKIWIGIDHLIEINCSFPIKFIIMIFRWILHFTYFHLYVNPSEWKSYHENRYFWCNFTILKQWKWIIRSCRKKWQAQFNSERFKSQAFISKYYVLIWFILLNIFSRCSWWVFDFSNKCSFLTHSHQS